MQGHRAEIGHLLLFGLVHSAAMAENIGPFAAMRAQEIAHIFNQTENRHFDAFKHRNATPRIDQSKILRR